MPITLTRSLLTILIPGLIAIAPWLLALVQNTKATLGFGEFSTLGTAFVFASAAVVGSLFENCGTFMEIAWDTEREQEHSVKENWHQYLSRTFEREPVGYRYLSRLVTSLYFELSMLFAVPSFIVGGFVLASLRFTNYWPLIGIVALGSAMITGYYFHLQARATHLVLCKTRAELNRRLSV